MCSMVTYITKTYGSTHGAVGWLSTRKGLLVTGSMMRLTHYAIHILFPKLFWIEID